MIQERTLTAAMKQAYAGGGYEVIGFTERGMDKFYIATETKWAVLVPRKLMGRKVLALLAEHLGEIPDGTAWTVSKARDAQMTAAELLLESREKLKQMCSGGEEIEQTMLTYGGRHIWQTDKKKVVLVPGYSAMAPEDATAYYANGFVSWNDGNCLLVVKEDPAELPEELEEALESIRLPT